MNETRRKSTTGRQSPLCLCAYCVLFVFYGSGVQVTLTFTLRRFISNVRYTLERVVYAFHIQYTIHRGLGGEVGGVGWVG